MSIEKLEFTAEQSSERLDKMIMAHIGDRLSRAQVQTLIEDGMVLVDEKALKPGAKLKGGERISLSIPVRDELEKVQPENIALNVVYEDDDLAVIDKPAGMVVHPGDLNETGTLVSAALHRWPQIATMNIEEKRAGIVHRLDKDTSGLIIIAKHDRARRNLMEQFHNRSVEKIYTALLEKRPQTLTGRIEVPIGRDPRQRKRMAVLREGRPAISEYTIIDDQFVEDYALVKVRLLTGRTHQIRVHMAFIGCPIVGDQVYGFRKQRVGLKRQFLHASEVTFDQPTSGERLHFESPLPSGLQNLLDKLKQG